jgi:hypothetical protein
MRFLTRFDTKVRAQYEGLANEEEPRKYRESYDTPVILLNPRNLSNEHFEESKKGKFDEERRSPGKNERRGIFLNGVIDHMGQFVRWQLEYERRVGSNDGGQVDFIAYVVHESCSRNQE